MVRKVKIMTSRQKYAKKYYKAHKEEFRKRARLRYQPKGNGKCKICGKDITNLENRHFRYCDECTKSKVSRQARWYRKNRKKLTKKRGKKC